MGVDARGRRDADPAPMLAVYEQENGEGVSPFGTIRLHGRCAMGLLARLEACFERAAGQRVAEEKRWDDGRIASASAGGWRPVGRGQTRAESGLRVLIGPRAFEREPQ